MLFDASHSPRYNTPLPCRHTIHNHPYPTQSRIHTRTHSLTHTLPHPHRACRGSLREKISWLKWCMGSWGGGRGGGGVYKNCDGPLVSFSRDRNDSRSRRTHQPSGHQPDSIPTNQHPHISSNTMATQAVSNQLTLLTDGTGKI